ncbi:methylaspartate mutase [Mycobacterium simiae]|uniref:Methylaspartate mutase n=1 Tax=Mycobacterium simiae TaxID=1784 RepID=A0A5B1BSJ3_MYCSI|nr:methylaspartate mutase [Mycobacterium simiae]KAA1250972.1 methylaspartate mutase [Mycobacterium simiae]
MSGFLDSFVHQHRSSGTLVVQPRMGFGAVQAMRSGLRALAELAIPVVGTLTLDSYTRVGDYVTPLQRLADGEQLNGFPLVSYPASTTAQMLKGLYGPSYPIQVRHGTPLPLEVFRRLVEVGLDATEGGPVSYCLPYSRVPLPQAVKAWSESCRFLAGETDEGHIETFGGCLLGQLCPPSLLVAIALIEACFFRQHGVRHMSLSYAQGTLAAQDRGALRALRTLAHEYLGDVDWHIVMYTYMGLFPETPQGARRLIRDSAQLAAQAGCERLIVKTIAESSQIATVQENVEALLLAAEAATAAGPGHVDTEFFEETMLDARCLVDTVLSLDRDIGRALLTGFATGMLDVPFCLHRDNRGEATAVIDSRGALRWATTGRLALPPESHRNARHREVDSGTLYHMLRYISDRYDGVAGPPHEECATRVD